MVVVDLYRVYILSCPSARQLFLIENLHLSGRPIIVVVFRDTTQDVLCIYTAAVKVVRKCLDSFLYSDVFNA
jgi:hypothetical protein